MAAVVHTFPRSVLHELDAPWSSEPLAEVVPIPQRNSMRAVYVRRRIASAAVALLIAAVVVVSVQTVFATAVVVQPTSQAVTVKAGEVYQVKPNDTLWSIVSAAHPGEDPRETIAKATKAGLSTQLQVGDIITVP